MDFTLVFCAGYAVRYMWFESPTCKDTLVIISFVCVNLGRVPAIAGFLLDWFLLFFRL